MSQEINNREYRARVLKNILRQLHEGATVDEVKQEFDETFGSVDASEISAAEQTLINEGLPVSEIQRLCDVHSSVFRGSIEEIHAPKDVSLIPGHPAHTLKAENRALEQLINTRLRPLLKDMVAGKGRFDELSTALRELQEIDKHYSIKENLLFPYMEQYGYTAPPQVMWGVDDEIRAALKDNLSAGEAGDVSVAPAVEETLTRIDEMIFKEENILLPILIEELKPEEWQLVAEESAEIGYTLIEAPRSWKAPATQDEPATAMEQTTEAAERKDAIVLPSGFFYPAELTAVLNTLPVDITFVAADDTVRYFSQTKERVFTRTKAIIGREVSNCHPPASVHIVEGIVEELRSGKKDHEDFWIQMGDKYIYIRYFAVRDESGQYLGVLEVTQDIKPIQDITGEKRLVAGADKL